MAEKTVKVRVFVAVGPGGHWTAHGWHVSDNLLLEEREDYQREHTMSHFSRYRTGEQSNGYWLTADLPVPDRDEPEVAAEVSDGD